MSTLAYILIGVVIGIIAGAFLGAYIATNFDVINNSYAIEKLRAKKGATINVSQENATEETEVKTKHKLFSKLKAKRAERKANNNNLK